MFEAPRAAVHGHGYGWQDAGCRVCARVRLRERERDDAAVSCWPVILDDDKAAGDGVACSAVAAVGPAPTATRVHV